MTKQFDDMIHFDPLAAAEKLTGKSYKEDTDTVLLGMLLTQEHHKMKKDEFSLRGDTYYGMNFDDAVSIIKGIGFEEVFSEEFTSRFSKDIPEQFKLFWKNGFLLTLETYQGTTVNSSTLYYNWEPYDQKNFGKFMSSGHISLFDGKDILVGDHDAREGLLNTIDLFEQNGRVLSDWKERPFLWLINHSKKSDDTNYTEENERVISLLPTHVQEKISV